MLKRLKALRAQLLARGNLHRWRRQIAVADTARLEQGFHLDFLATPDDRCYVRIGERSMLNMKISFESRQGHVEIGERVYIGGGSIICRERITIGNDVTIAWGVCIYDHNSNAFDWRQRAKVVKHFYDHHGSQDCYEGIDWTGVASSPIVIEDRAWIGFDAVILKGVRVGEGAVVGARAVVTKDVEPYTIVAGNPARFVKRVETR